MNDDLEQRLERLQPRGAAAELREHVLDAVAEELAAPTRRWRPRLGVAVAASLLMSLALNIWVSKSADRRMARLYGPRPVPKAIAEIVDAVASVTDAETGQRLQRQLLVAWDSRPARSEQGIAEYRRMVNELIAIGKDWGHEKAKEDAQMDRDRSRNTDRDTSTWQRDLGLDYQFTA